jgi:murein DD-endopeptidase MepM/ murein hydrolase activator NlpD
MLIAVGCLPEKDTRRPVESQSIAAIPAVVDPTKTATQKPDPTSTKSPIPPTPFPATVTPLPCGEDWCIYDGHFLLERPIKPQDNLLVERSYPFGTTQGGLRNPHHGVEFTNAQGTSVLAAGDGKVIVAGTDHKTEYGWGLDYYGNLVIIQHEIPGYALPIYTLYAHLSKVLVEPGQSVQAGEEIGKVGSTGSAQGAHLHFEVRQGGNSFQDTRNPELWIKPCGDCGILAGTILDPEGSVRRYSNIKIEKMDGELAGKPIYLESYADPSLKSDDQYQEIFSLGDLTSGDYRVTFSPNGVSQQLEVQILPDKVSKIVLHVKN